jgi:hypothetical protein
MVFLDQLLLGNCLNPKMLWLGEVSLCNFNVALIIAHFKYLATPILKNSGSGELSYGLSTLA